MHPHSGREMKIDAAIYEPFKAVFFQNLKGSKGKSFSMLTDEVTKIIRKKLPGFNKSIPWYTISIRLYLETRGGCGNFYRELSPYRSFLLLLACRQH